MTDKQVQRKLKVAQGYLMSIQSHPMQSEVVDIIAKISELQLRLVNFKRT